MKTLPKIDTEESATDFMLAEYATLRELRLSLDSLGESRMNFYLAVISGSVVGLGLLNQLSGLAKTIFFINAAVIVGLLFLGSITFVRMLQRTVNIVEYTRGMNRIRRFFSEKNPDITPYLWLSSRFSLYDDRPRIGYKVFDFQTRRLKFAGLAPMVGVINSIIATLGIVILTSTVFILPVAWSVLIGLFTFLLMLIAHYTYLVNYLKQKHDEMEVRFPTPHKNQ
jgi:hypothetical protein